MPVLTLFATLLSPVQSELVLGVVTDDDVNPVGSPSLSHTVVPHHTRYLSNTLRTQMVD